MTADLVAFLRARIGEAEHEANELNVEIIPGMTLWQTFFAEPSGLDDAVDYIDKFAGPKHVLRDVEAKRRIIDEYAHWLDKDDGDHPYAVGLRNAVMLLAEADAEHPDWQREWKR